MWTPGAKARVGSVAANTSSRPSVGWLVIRWPPHLAQYWRWLSGPFWNVARCSSPAVTRTCSGFQRLNAFTGPPDQDRQDPQWQYPIASGSPEASSAIAPQKQV